MHDLPDIHTLHLRDVETNHDDKKLTDPRETSYEVRRVPRLYAQHPLCGHDLMNDTYGVTLVGGHGTGRRFARQKALTECFADCHGP